MADIKTRDVVKGTIKKIDKAAIAADRMRSAYVQAKEKAEHTTHPDEHNAEEYASDRVEGGVDRITHEAAHQFDKQGRKGLEETKRNVSKAKDGVQRFREKRAAESIKRQTVDTGVVPKYAGCVNGVQWFKDRGQWIDGSAEPVPGMIIFFDWDNKGSSGPQDGQSDHTGIVQKVENGIVYTVEGNSGDSCRVNQYSVGHYEILGYGVPQY